MSNKPKIPNWREDEREAWKPKKERVLLEIKAQLRVIDTHKAELRRLLAEAYTSG